jgi:hypothetical protein
MPEEAKCKCGKSRMTFPNLRLADVDGKWENECCEEAAQKSQKTEEKEPKKEAKKSSKKKEKALDEPKE